MQIIRLDEDVKLEWDEVVRSSPDGWLFHLYDWISLVQDVWKLKSFSFLIKSDEGAILGIFPLFLEQGNRWKMFRPKVLISGKGGAGPAIINGISQDQKKEILRELFNYIDSLADEIGADKLIIELPVCSRTYLRGAKTDANPLVPFGFKETSTSAYILDLSQDLEVLWKRSRHALRKNVRKAQRFGIKITFAGRFADIEEYYSLHMATYKRTGAHPHPFEYFKLIWERFVLKGMARIFFAEYRGKKIAALNVITFKNICSYWTTCSDPNFRSLGAGNLIRWEVTKWAKQSGNSRINIGEVHLNSDNEKLLGIYRFKKNIGADLYPFYKGLKVYRPMRVSFFDMIHRMRDKLI